MTTKRRAPLTWTVIWAHWDGDWSRVSTSWTRAEKAMAWLRRYENPMRNTWRLAGGVVASITSTQNRDSHERADRGWVSAAPPPHGAPHRRATARVAHARPAKLDSWIAEKTWVGWFGRCRWVPDSILHFAHDFRWGQYLHFAGGSWWA